MEEKPRDLQNWLKLCDELELVITYDDCVRCLPGSGTNSTTVNCVRRTLTELEFNVSQVFIFSNPYDLRVDLESRLDNSLIIGSPISLSCVKFHLPEELVKLEQKLDKLDSRPLIGFAKLPSNWPKQFTLKVKLKRRVDERR